MQVRFFLFLIALINAAWAPAQSVPLPPLLELEMMKAPRQFEPGVSRDKALAPTDYVFLGIEMDKGGNWQAIKDLGGEVNTQLGGWGTVRLPKPAVRALASLPDLQAIHYNPLLLPHNEEAVKHVQADKVHAGLAPLPQGYAGEDVVVGIIDTGIDYLHDDFRDPDNPGRSRIVYFWDQWALEGTLPASFSYGAEWPRTRIESEIATRPTGPFIHKDTFPEGAGHGTHVGGTAAGNRGLAYRSDLIVVATNFSEAGILDAANYIMQKAQEMGKPCVINLSLGTNIHAHDGTDFLSESLSQLAESREGVVIVASAGNDGDELAHWGGFPLSSEPAAVYYGGGTGVYAYFRVPKSVLSDFEISIAVDTVHYWNGILRSVAEIGRTPWLKLAGLGEQPYYLPFYNPNDSLAVELYLFNATDKEKDHAEFLIFLDEGWNRYNWVRHRDELELFRFYVRGSGSFHAWFDSFRLYTFANPDIAGLTEPNYRPPDTDYNLGSPCDGRSVLCVGAYTNRTSWTDANGQLRAYSSAQAVGDLADFSSTGPTMDNRIKPEIIAPGKAVASAVPPYNEYGGLATSFDPAEAIFSGTSMSAPVVSGAVALLLQANPFLTAEEVRNIITSTALQDQQARSKGPLPNGYWGYGKLNVFDAMLAVLGVTASDDPLAEPFLMSVFPNPAQQTVNLLFQGGDRTEGAVRLRDLNGREVLRVLDSGAGETLRLDISGLPRGMYLLEWTDGRRRALKKVVVN